jgi:hypothetical protein
MPILEWGGFVLAALSLVGAALAYYIRTQIKSSADDIRHPVLSRIQDLDDKNTTEHHELRGRVQKLADDVSSNAVGIARLESRHKEDQ